MFVGSGSAFFYVVFRRLVSVMVFLEEGRGGGLITQLKIILPLWDGDGLFKNPMRRNA